MPSELREKIFQPFFQHAPKSEFAGTGFGLALAHSLVELQHGSLSMGKSETENEFVLTLPLTTQEVDGRLPDAEDDMQDDRDAEREPAEERCNILVVEDHAQMREFISRFLSEYYTVFTAGNGLEALEQLDKSPINIIVTDVMMPGMNGMDLCRKVKGDLRYSHIPLILLTARTNIQTKIQGMNIGADIYIEKPFSSAYLLSAIANLIKSRRVLYNSFMKNPLMMASRMTTTSTDMRFIQKLQDIVHANFNNSEFNSNDIARLMCMSRASFYRKVKGILDVSPNDYIRIERLKTAAQLLKEGQYQINEVCYMVGFSSPSYFARCFQKQFGIVPKQFVAGIKRSGPESADSQ